MKKVLVLALVGIMLIGAGAVVFAAQTEIWGRVESIDGNVITASNNRLGEITITVDSSSEITIDGESASISDIVVPSGFRGTVEEVSESNYKAVELDFKASCAGGDPGSGGPGNGGPPDGVEPGSFVGGFVVSVNESTRTIVINNRRDDTDYTVKLTSDAVITKDDVEVALSEISVDDHLMFDAEKQDDGTYLATSGRIDDMPRGGGAGNGGGTPPEDGNNGGRKGGRGGQSGSGGKGGRGGN